MPYVCPQCGSMDTYKERMFGTQTGDRKCLGCGYSDVARDFWVDEQKPVIAPQWKQDGNALTLELAGGLICCKVVDRKPEPLWSVNGAVDFDLAQTIEECKTKTIAKAKELLTKALAEIEQMKTERP